MTGGRTLRIECYDKLFDWFDVEEEREIIQASDVLKIVKENVAHYFNVPLDKQVIFDQEGVIATPQEFRRSLRIAGKPKVVVADITRLSNHQEIMFRKWHDELKQVVEATPGLIPAVQPSTSPVGTTTPVVASARARSVTPQPSSGRSPMLQSTSVCVARAGGDQHQAKLTPPFLPGPPILPAVGAGNLQSVPMRLSIPRTTAIGSPLLVQGSNVNKNVMLSTQVTNEILDKFNNNHHFKKNFYYNNDADTGDIRPQNIRMLSGPPSVGLNPSSSLGGAPALNAQASQNQATSAPIVDEQLLDSGPTEFQGLDANVEGQGIEESTAEEFQPGENYPFNSSKAMEGQHNQEAVVGIDQASTIGHGSTIVQSDIHREPSSSSSSQCLPRDTVPVKPNLLSTFTRTQSVPPGRRAREAAASENQNAAAEPVSTYRIQTSANGTANSGSTHVSGSGHVAGNGSYIGNHAGHVLSASGNTSYPSTSLGNRNVFSNISNTMHQRQNLAQMSQEGKSVFTTPVLYVPGFATTSMSNLKSSLNSSLTPTVPAKSPGYQNLSLGFSSTFRSQRDPPQYAQQSVPHGVTMHSSGQSSGLQWGSSRHIGAQSTVHLIQHGGSQSSMHYGGSQSAMQEGGSQSVTQRSSLQSTQPNLLHQRSSSYQEHFVRTNKGSGVRNSPTIGTRENPYQPMQRNIVTSHPGGSSSVPSQQTRVVADNAMTSHQAVSNSVIPYHQATSGSGAHPTMCASAVAAQQAASTEPSQPKDRLEAHRSERDDVMMRSFEEQKNIILELEKSGGADERYGFTTIGHAPNGQGYAGLEITKVERGGLLAQWNTSRRSGGPTKMVGVGDVVLTVNGVGPTNIDDMRNQLDFPHIVLQVAKMRT